MGSVLLCFVVFFFGAVPLSATTFVLNYMDGAKISGMYFGQWRYSTTDNASDNFVNTWDYSMERPWLEFTSVSRSDCSYGVRLYGPFSAGTYTFNLEYDISASVFSDSVSQSVTVRTDARVNLYYSSGVSVVNEGEYRHVIIDIVYVLDADSQYLELRHYSSKMVAGTAVVMPSVAVVLYDDGVEPPPVSSSSTPPASSSTPPASSSTPPASSSTPPASSSTPPASSSTPPASSSTPPASSSTPPVSSSTPPASSSEPVASSSSSSSVLDADDKPAGGDAGWYHVNFGSEGMVSNIGFSMFNTLYNNNTVISGFYDGMRNYIYSDWFRESYPLKDYLGRDTGNIALNSFSTLSVVGRAFSGVPTFRIPFYFQAGVNYRIHCDVCIDTLNVGTGSWPLWLYGSDGKLITWTNLTTGVREKNHFTIENASFTLKEDMPYIYLVVPGTLQFNDASGLKVEMHQCVLYYPQGGSSGGFEVSDDDVAAMGDMVGGVTDTIDSGAGGAGEAEEMQGRLVSLFKSGGSTQLRFPAFSLEIQGEVYEIWSEYIFDFKILDEHFGPLMVVVRMGSVVVVYIALVRYVMATWDKIFGTSPVDVDGGV